MGTRVNLRFILWALALFAGPAAGQELEPRAYSPNPIGANFLVQSYAFQSGDVLFDPALPFSDVVARINTSVTGYGRAFSLFGRSASVLVMAPYAWGSMKGNVGEDFQQITRSGFADLRAKFTVTLLGGPALKPREFVLRKPSTTLGASFTASFPTGQYDPAKLINIGTNRWAFKPELGLSHPIGPWTLEAYAGVWFFGDNADFNGGKVRSQNPLTSFQAHVAYTLRPRMWIAGNATYYTGGVSYVNDVPTDTRQANSRVGLTFSLPLGTRHSIKLSYANGVTSRIGSNFSTYGIAYQFFWLDRPRPAK